MARLSQPNIAARISPCLWFDGDAEDAARFYVSLFPDSAIVHVHPNVVESRSGPAGSVLLVEFTLAGQRFLALNGGQAMEYTHAVSLSVECADQAEVDRLWAGLLADGGVAECCGWLRDRWGLCWQIVPAVMPGLLTDADPATAARVMEAMLAMTKLDIAALERAAAG
ncbi:VOC family protein [Xanthobacter sp. V3C-3]|uniref:VOC family protein n=1 Tax=Xanthobacter lutulentifluminis TaxID=3119935 RepID=UPI003726E2E4